MFLRNQAEVHFGYFYSPQRRGCYCHSMNPTPFKAAWDLSALKSLPSLLSLPSMPDTHMGGRLLDLGAQLAGVGEVAPSCRRSFSRLSSELFPLAPYPSHVRDCPHVLHRHVSVLPLCACPPICSWGSWSCSFL